MSMSLNELLNYCNSIRKDSNLFIHKSDEYVYLKFIRLLKGVENTKYLIQLLDIKVYGVIELEVTLKISDLNKINIKKMLDI